MSKDYFLAKNNQKEGPFDFKNIKSRIEKGEVTQDTLIWSEGMDGWRPASEVKELSSLFTSTVQPPPLPSNQAMPPPLPENDMSAGLSSWEQKAYRFATTMYRPWRGKHSPIGAYVRKNPKSAVFVSLGTITVLLLILILFVSSFSSDPNSPPQYTQQQQMPTGQMPPPNWQAGYSAWQDAHRYNQKVIDDTYTYGRDSFDRMHDTYRDATYDWVKDKD